MMLPSIALMVVSLSMSILSVWIFIVIYGRIIEIYLTVSLGPILLAMMANHEWGSIG